MDSPTPQTSPRQHRTVPTKKILLISGVAIVVGALGIWIYILVGSSTPTDYSKVTAPTHYTVLPDNRTIESLGGWRLVSPPEKEPVFAFSDQVEDVNVLISQQILPKARSDDNGKRLEEIATGFNANRKINNEAVTLYVGTSAKGPQSVFMIKKNLLIMMKSSQKISDTAWLTYAASLN